MLLELHNLRKYFPVKKRVFAKRQVVRAVDGIDFTVSEGEHVGIVGESGCGKTTLGRLITRLLPSDTGEILFYGKNITHLRNREMRPLRRDMQMVFQDPYSSLDPRFTVQRIIEEAMIFDKVLSRSQKQEKIEELLLSVRLSQDILERYSHEFSGGERQRIAIARALAVNPKLLILDEAVSSLDVLVQNQIIELLLDLKEKFSTTYIFISHNLRVVRKICAKIAVMYRGKIVEVATTEELFKNPLHPYTKELLWAALYYKTSKEARPASFHSDAKLADRGNGHFVLGD